MKKITLTLVSILFLSGIYAQNKIPKVSLNKLSKGVCFVTILNAMEAKTIRIVKQ